MSRIGKKPITLPKGVEVKVEGDTIKVKGPKGQLSQKIHDTMSVAVEGGSVRIVPKSPRNDIGQFHGLTRTLVANMVQGCAEGFTKSLSLVGVGYRAAAKGKGVTLNLGHSHAIDFDAPAGIEIKVEKQTSIVVSGADKELVGRVSATLRSLRAPEPYHGKGARYADEVIVTKVGKAAGKK
ncbi:50S ribosomal protein L6 [bacterium]|nr:50S ribosomal protein L6 [bacterium]